MEVVSMVVGGREDDLFLLRALPLILYGTGVKK